MAKKKVEDTKLNVRPAFWVALAAALLLLGGLVGLVAALFLVYKFSTFVHNRVSKGSKKKK